jgi:hypothetical protein
MRYTCVVLALPLAVASVSMAMAADEITQEQFEARHSGAAVSDVNAKIDFGYYSADFGNDGDPLAEFDSAHGTYVQGAVSIPVGNMFGLQIDAGSMNVDVNGANGFQDFGVQASGVAGHFFWRDPSMGLLGVYGHHVSYEFDNGPNDKIENTRIGVEAEAYLGNFTLKGFAGQDHLDWDFVSNDEKFWTGSGEINYYINDNFMLTAGVDHSFETTSASVGVEAFADMGGFSPSLYANAKFSGDDRTIMAGLRIYLGRTAKTLKARHREDDPEINLFDNFAQIGTCLNNALSGGPSSMPIYTGKSYSPPSSGFTSNIGPVMTPDNELDGCNLDTTFSVQPLPPPPPPD